MIDSQLPPADPIQFCFDTILKEARQEERLVKQLVYTMLSAYTNNPINLAVNSPSGEGKDYVITKVGDNFPKQDIMFLAGMTDKALFHRQGILVIKNNESGEYESIEDKIAEIDSQIEDYESEIATKAHDKNFRQGKRSLIKQLEQQKKDLLKDARKLIDLSHKILVFLDTPRPELFNALMPLLSHDHYEVEYEFADSTNTGIKTRSNILRGWPAVISAQAIDWSKYQRYPEIQRRFIVTNPKMTREKYAAAIDLTVDKFGLPDFMYQQRIVSDSDKERVREIISQIKDTMLHVSDRIAPGKNCVFVPFRESLKPQLPAQKAFDMTTANRFGSFLNLLPLINIDKRPGVVLRAEGNPISQVIPFALFEDLKESMFLMEYADGVRPYVMEWYYDVFLEAFNGKTIPDFKTVTNSKGEETKIEKIIALTTEDLVKKTKEVYNHVYTKHQIRDTYIYPLINQGYIDETDSELDKRQKILYPLVVLEKSSKNERLHDKNKSLNLFQQSKILVENHELYPSREYIIFQIEALLKCMIQTPFFKIKEIKILDHTGRQIVNLDHGVNDVDVAKLGELVDTYYHNPADYFHFNYDNIAEVEQTAASSLAVGNNILYGYQVLQNHLSKLFFDKNDLEISHFQNANITNEFQQIPIGDIENIIENLGESRKLSDNEKISQSLSFQELEPSANNLEEWWQKERKKITPLDSSYYAFTFTEGYQCCHCDFKTENKGHYESHVIMSHGHSPAYPNKAEIEKRGLKLQGKELGGMTLQQPTLESFGFDIAGSNKIGGNLACATSSTNNNQIPICYPFVKWAGGKTQLLSQLSALAPARFDRYFEPFVGGGALFFNLISDKNKQFTAYISDINAELINAHVAVKDNVEKLIKLLTHYEVGYNQDPEEYYYKLRNDFNLRSCSDMIERASQFITLNRTCFNGLYRVNRKGEFNVPWGKYKNPSICDSSNLRNVSHILSKPGVIVKACDYKEILLQNAKEGDFIYLDPPYSPISSTAYFTNYTNNGFSYKDQKELAEKYKQLDEMKCKVMLTNSNTPLVRDLYAPFAITEVGSKRAINCKAAKREGHTDLIIRNYS